MDSLFDRAGALFRTLALETCDALEAIDGHATFSATDWTREGGSHGQARALRDGNVFEKGSVNTLSIAGQVPEEFADQVPGDDRAFRATGVWWVIHPLSPMVPTAHASFRYVEKGDQRWFGGGVDMTPYYFFREDAVHLHRTLRDACDRYASIADYARFKDWCDEYFYLPHRGETRGVGGIYFDYLTGEGDAVEQIFELVTHVGRAFLTAYNPIVERRRGMDYGDAERRWQLRRRGRYVEFNLIYDRSTLFGLKNNGQIETILMSLPPLVRWDYDIPVESGSREFELLSVLKPIDWLANSED